MAAQAVACVLGVWLMAAPGALGYGGPARVNDLVIGPVAASIACMAMWQVLRALRWGNVALGGWLVLAPLILGYDSIAIGHSILLGGALAGCSFVRGRIARRMGGGWRALATKGATRQAG